MTRPTLFLVPCLALLACDTNPAEAKPAATAKGSASQAASSATDKTEPAAADKPVQAAPQPAPTKVESPRVEFAAMPADAVPMSLEMQGGQLRVPKGTKKGRNINGWQELSSGDAFTMIVRESFDEVSKAKAELTDVKFIVDEPDTLVYEKGGAFGFVQRVQAKGPEVLEGEADRTFECRAGSALDWAVSKKPKLYPRETIDLMVATCRTLEIPPLEE